MGTVFVIVGGIVLCFLARTILSIVLSLLSGAAYAGTRVVGKIPAILVASVVASVLGLTWTAFLYLWAERIVEADYAVAWVTWLMAIVAAGLPLSDAIESGRRFQRTQRLTDDQDGLGMGLGLASKFQFVGMIAMFFSETALGWWRWLPV